MDLEVAPEDLTAVAAFVAARQTDPAHHIGYLSVEPEAIAVQLRGLEPLGTGGLVVARVRGRVVGALAAEWDEDPPRCWWHGPFVAPDADWREVGDALLDGARRLLPATVTQEETCGDERHAWLADFATRHGFVAEEPSAVLVRDLDDGLPPVTVPVAARDDLTDAQRAEVAALHDRLFPGTHTPGRRLVDGVDDNRLLVVLDDGRAIAYAAVERHEDDGSGYLDFLGVDASARGRGLGAALVAAACHEMRHGLGCLASSLTVRAGNAAARRVYQRNGFVEERVIVPFRRGFALT
ncbi:GNAT family N-acetyltransferase [Egicoccus sp. AB-alg2]|uniref:GNAT family N-acetyltransferase n=1 Tax=Egicoccus sp. AB-alg2 TaxID=3242693 RepID=UPI00359E8623